MSQSGVIKYTNNVPGETTYVENSGNAAPIAGVLNIVGTNGITTIGSGNTVTISSTDHSLVGTVNTIGAVTGDAITFALGAVAGTYTFDVKVAGFNAVTPAGAGYGIIASVRTTGAAAVLVPNQAIDEMEEAALVPADAQMVVAGNNAIVRVLGVAGLTIDWKAVAEYTFVS